jgi:hypothetical protein
MQKICKVHETTSFIPVFAWGAYNDVLRTLIGMLKGWSSAQVPKKEQRQNDMQVMIGEKCQMQCNDEWLDDSTDTKPKTICQDFTWSCMKTMSRLLTQSK